MQSCAMQEGGVKPSVCFCVFAFKVSLKCLITLCAIECVVCVFEERSKRAKSSVVSSPFLDLRSVLQFMCALSLSLSVYVSLDCCETNVSITIIATINDNCTSPGCS